MAYRLDIPYPLKDGELAVCRILLPSSTPCHLFKIFTVTPCPIEQLAQLLPSLFEEFPVFGIVELRLVKEIVQLLPTQLANFDSSLSVMPCKKSAM